VVLPRGTGNPEVIPGQKSSCGKLQRVYHYSEGATFKCAIMLAKGKLHADCGCRKRKDASLAAHVRSIQPQVKSTRYGESNRAAESAKTCYYYVPRCDLRVRRYRSINHLPPLLPASQPIACLERIAIQSHAVEQQWRGGKALRVRYWSASIEIATRYGVANRVTEHIKIGSPPLDFYDSDISIPPRPPPVPP